MWDLTIVIVCLTAGISTIAFLALWFWVVHKELQNKRNMRKSAGIQLAACRKQVRQAKDGWEKEEAEGILNRSLDIYRQSVKLYRQTLKKPWNLIPGFLMGYHEAKGASDAVLICPYCRHSVLEKNRGECYQNGFCQYDEHVNEKALRELAEAKRMLETLVTNIKGGIITCIYNIENHSSEAIYINPGWTDITGYTLEELNTEKYGNPLYIVFSEDMKGVDRSYGEQMAKGNEYELMYRVCRRDGRIIWVLDRGIASGIGYGKMQHQSIITEMTALKEREENLRRLAQMDQLTTLYNKETTTRLAQAALEQGPQRWHGVFMLDIDGFKDINDTMGHAFGDEVLKGVANCLKMLFSSSDILGRLGGDEFGMIVIELLPKEAKTKAKEICEAIPKINIGTGAHPPITVSLGVALSQGNTSWQALYEQADTALYTAKSRGKNQYYINYFKSAHPLP